LKKSFGLAAVAALLAGTPALSATLTDFHGKVLVNKGNGFAPIAAGAELGAGDRLLVGEGAFAVLAYEDCAVSISKPAVVTIAKETPCAARQSGEMIQPALGTPPAVSPPLPLLLGVGVVAVGGFIVFGVLDSDDDDPPTSGP
jgi:hypothetical protein